MTAASSSFLKLRRSAALAARAARSAGVFLGLSSSRAAEVRRVRVGSDLPATALDGDRPQLDSLGAYLPYDEIIEDHFMALSAAEPGRP